MHLDVLQFSEPQNKHMHAHMPVNAQYITCCWYFHFHWFWKGNKRKRGRVTGNSLVKENAVHGSGEVQTHFSRQSICLTIQPVHTCTSSFVDLFMCACVYMCLCACVCICVYVHVCVYVYAHMNARECMGT